MTYARERGLRAGDVFANFERMRREIDELFGDVFERSGIRARTAASSPAWTSTTAATRRRAIVKAEIAGVDIGEVDVEIRGRQLVLTGERRPPEAEGRLYQQIEIEHGPFRRVVELGADVVAEEARATYEDGILARGDPARPPDAQGTIAPRRRSRMARPSEHRHHPGAGRRGTSRSARRCPSRCRCCR